MQKNSKVVHIETPYRSKFLVNAFSNWCVIVRVTGDQRFVARTRYSWKILNKLLLLLIVKSNKFLKKTPVLESHLDKLQTWRSNFLKKRFWHKFFSSKICEIFNSTYFEEHLWFSASVSFGNFIYDASKRCS